MHECVNEATAGTLTGDFAALPDSSFSLARPGIGSDWLIAGCGVRGVFFSRHIQPFVNYDLVVSASQPLHAGLGGIEFVWHRDHSSAGEFLSCQSALLRWTPKTRGTRPWERPPVDVGQKRDRIEQLARGPQQPHH
jgi:hypothetical protein